MIPRWQFILAAVAIAVAVVLVVATSPNSFTYAMVSGQCSKQPAPPVCATSARGRGARRSSQW